MTAKTVDNQDVERSSFEEPRVRKVVLTASDVMQYFFEGDERKGVSEYSIFTKAIVESLEFDTTTLSTRS
jgi:hypothetical protein